MTELFLWFCDRCGKRRGIHDTCAACRLGAKKAAEEDRLQDAQLRELRSAS